MNPAPAIQYIPLDKLRLSPKNVRRTRDPEAVDQLAASIRAHGLLQNLGVEATANDDGNFDVITGGTRLLALQQLAQENPDYVDGGVPCRFITNGETIEASAAENLVRTRLSPADEFDAYKKMADAGKSRGEIAAHFGVAEIVVSRSLKLANVDPQLFHIFREGGMDLDQLRALALTDDHVLQQKAWFGVKYDHERSHWNIRERLTRADVRTTDTLAKFVTIEAYEAAGGAVRRDLFGKDAWLEDRSLLESLAMDKLEAIAEGLRGDGWSWVETHLGMDYSQLNEFPVGFNSDAVKTAPLAPEQQARVAVINARLEEISNEADAGDADEAALYEEQESLEEELEQIEGTQQQVWPQHALQQSGCLVYVDDYNGAPRIAYARLRPGQKADAAGNVTGKVKPTSAEKAAAAKDKPKAPTLSGDMEQRLHLHHRGALRHDVANDHNFAIELLLTQLLADLFTPSTETPVLSIRVTNHHASDIGSVAVKYADVKASPAREALDGHVAALKKALPKKASEISGWLATRSVDQLHGLFALVAAVTLDPSKTAAAALAKQLKTDMRTWWKPDADHFLNHVPKGLVAEAVREVHGKDPAEKVAALKKDAAIAEAGKLLANTGWLPKPLRGDTYSGAKPAKSPQEKPVAKKAPTEQGVKKSATSKKPAKKVPAKKSVKKAAQKKATPA